MPKNYGYCRVSTKTQNIERQIENISKAYPTAEIHTEMSDRVDPKHPLKVLPLILHCNYFDRFFYFVDFINRQIIIDQQLFVSL